MADSIKILQINTNHSYSAIEHLKITIHKIQPNIIALQEPYYYKNKILGFNLTDIVIQNKDKARVAMVIRERNWDIFPEQVTRDIISIKVTTKNVRFRIINVYKPPNDDIDQTLDILENILNLDKDIPTTVLGDFNAKHQAWGGDRSDTQGDKLAQFIINNSLYILNDKDQGPTYLSTTGRSYIDLTLTNATLFREINKWEILDLHTESDHKYLLTSCYSDQTTVTERLTAKGEIKFNDYIRNDPWMVSLKEVSIRTKEQLSYIIDHLYKKIIQLIVNLSKKVKNNLKSLIWWNTDLEIERKKTGALRRRYQKCSNSTRNEHKARYKNALYQYKKHIREAKESSWHNFCTEVARSNIFSLPYKIAANKTKHTVVIPPIKGPGGHKSKSLEESINLILHYHFPEDRPEEYTEHQKTIISSIEENQTGYDDLAFTLTEVETVVNQLASRTAPGPDQLKTSMVKSIFKSHPIVILKIFNACLEHKFYPDIWKKSRVILLPKKEQDKNEPRNYRPICISSIFGKILEKLLNNRIYHFLNHNQLLHQLQYGFTHGKSATTALYHLKEKIETYQKEKRKCILISLDISNAFNSIWRPVLFSYFKKIKLPKNLYFLLKEVLSNRSLEYNLNTKHITKKMSLGCPQGSPLSPLMWNVIMSTLLNETIPEKTHIQAFADDLLILVTGKTRREIEFLTKQIMGKINIWSKDNKINFNPKKSQFLLLGPDYQKRPPIVKLEEKTIRNVKELKILGVIFDSGLSFLPHLTYIRKKVTQVTHALANFSGLNWGYNSQNFRKLYLRSIEKIITYGGPVYYKKEFNSHQKRKLKAIQRIPMLKITKGFRTVSNINLNILANLIPIHLVLEKEITMFNLFQIKRDQEINGKCITIKELEYPTDMKTIHPSKQIGYPFTEIQDQKINLNLDIEIYTDGSVSNKEVGAAYIAMKPNSQILHFEKFRLSENATIYDAEVLAIKHALLYVSSLKEGYKIGIISDSKSSLQSISNPINNNVQVNNIKEILNEVKVRQEVLLFHIKSHTNNYGNDMADKLANDARKNGKQMNCSLSKRYIKQILMDKQYKDWDKFWKEMGKDTSLYEWIPSVDSIPDYFPTNYFQTQIFTNHGRFPYYFFKFGKTNDSTCPCGKLAIEFKHYYSECPLTANIRSKLDTYGNPDFNVDNKRKYSKNETFMKLLAEMVELLAPLIEQV